jgi:hypothetical protein
MAPMPDDGGMINPGYFFFAAAGFVPANPPIEDRERFCVTPVPAHKQVEQPVCIAVDLLKLPDGVRLLAHNLAGASKRHDFRDGDFRTGQAELKDLF